jgi:hypothetical protein
VTRPPHPSGVPSAPGASLERAREDFLRHLLERVESGAVPASEYPERVRLLELATTVDEMAEIATAAPAAAPALDPVDMLLLARTAKQQAGAARRPRYFIVAVLLFFFVVLLVAGLWLAAHARALHNSGNVGTVAGRVVPGATAAPTGGLS